MVLLLLYLAIAIIILLVHYFNMARSDILEYQKKEIERFKKAHPEFIIHIPNNGGPFRYYIQFIIDGEKYMTFCGDSLGSKTKWMKEKKLVYVYSQFKPFGISDDLKLKNDTI